MMIENPARNISYQTNYNNLDFTTLVLKLPITTNIDSNGNSVTKRVIFL